MIDSELRLIELELKYPERFLSFPEDHKALARWNGKPTELLEYITPLQLTGKFLKPSGEPMAFSDIVRVFEAILGITVNKLYETKSRLLARKKNITPFIDSMKYALIEEAKKSYL